MIIKNEWLKMGCSLSRAVEITSAVGYKIITNKWLKMDYVSSFAVKITNSVKLNH